MSPVLSPGQTRIVLTWDEYPADLDIHVMAFNKRDGSLCRTWYQHKRGCDAIIQDIDNRNGGFNGAETVTLLDRNVNKNYNYMIAVEDFGFEENGRQFLKSDARISITNGIQNVEIEMTANQIDQDNTFYLFGCLNIHEDSRFEFKKAIEGVIFNGYSNAQWANIMKLHCGNFISHSNTFVVYSRIFHVENLFRHRYT